MPNPKRVNLTDEQIREIRRRYKTEFITTRQIAKEYGISKSTAHAIVSRLSWAHIPEEPEVAHLRHPKKTTEERFLDKIIKDPSGCWLWVAATNEFGYGAFGVGKHNIVPAHRYSYELFVGPIPDGLFILHSCDVPQCVNPAHLRPGTQQENIDDMISRGRQGKRDPLKISGMNSKRAKLTDDQVIEIRHIYRSGNTSQKTLSKQYGVSQRCVQFIVTNQHWKHLLEDQHGQL